MLTYQHLHRQVSFYQSLTQSVQVPQKVWVYVVEDNYKLKQITVSDFPNYEFVRYTYANSSYPDVKRSKCVGSV